jgi:hypothetical protein
MMKKMKMKAIYFDTDGQENDIIKTTKAMSSGCFG